MTEEDKLKIENTLNQIRIKTQIKDFDVIRFTKPLFYPLSYIPLNFPRPPCGRTFHTLKSNREVKS
jgi:hypothetical protein